MKRALYVFWQHTWGVLQTTVGLAFYLVFLRCPHFRYQGTVVTIWPIRQGSMSMGRFLFMHPNWTPADQRLLAHEYGHTIQSLLLGPLYLPLIGLPSLLWASVPWFERYRRTHRVDYYDLYTERWANHCGARYAKAPKGLPAGFSTKK